MSTDREPACTDTELELWYGPNDDQEPESVHQRQWRERLALQICGTCPVHRTCLIDELTQPINRQYGVSGGMTAGQRRRLLAKWRKAGSIGTCATPDRTLVADLLDAEERSA